MSRMLAELLDITADDLMVKLNGCAFWPYLEFAAERVYAACILHKRLMPFTDSGEQTHQVTPRSLVSRVNGYEILQKLNAATVMTALFAYLGKALQKI